MHRKSQRMTKVVKAATSFALNALLVVGSLLVCFVGIELYLRIFHPVYEGAANPGRIRDVDRIWRREPNSSRTWRHPDTKVDHTIFYNNAGLRQGRNFEEQDLAGKINIGFFGDSFTENRNVPGPNVFVEVLDYLLNCDDAGVNVLNFGVDGYGTGQSYLCYHLSPLAQQLDYVFYVFCANDIRNIYETQLFDYSDETGLIANSARREQWHIKLLGRFHAVYLFLDLSQRFMPAVRAKLIARVDERRRGDLRVENNLRRHSPPADALTRILSPDESDTESIRYVKTFFSILDRWQTEVNDSGGNFTVVTLPRPDELPSAPILAERFEVLDLYAEFDRTIDDYSWDDMRFENDGHWSEKGNMYCAIECYRFLTRKLGINPVSDAELKQRLTDYYSAFPEYWRPFDGDPETGLSADELERITQRYSALRLSQADDN